MKGLLTVWNEEVIFIRGAPRHSESQGLVERGNYNVERKIGKMRTDWDHEKKGPFPWASWLPAIQFSLNNSHHRVIKDTPYRVVYGTHPPAPMFPFGFSSKECLCEEKLEAEGVYVAKPKVAPVPR